MSATAAEIAAYLGETGHLQALVTATGSEPAQISLSAVNAHFAARPGELAWSRAAHAESFRGGLLICPEPAPDPATLQAGQTVAVCTAPRLAMARVLQRFFAELAADREPVYAEPELARVVADGNCWVKNATIGPRVFISPLVSIGCRALAYERDEQGRLVHFPQLGGVIVEADVDIGTHSSILRGALTDTVVRRGAKLGSHVNVGHNVEVGEDALIASHVQIGGSVRLGRGAAVWQAATIANGVTIGDGAVIGMAAAVRDDVPAGEVWVGVPARRLR